MPKLSFPFLILGSRDASGLQRVRAAGHPTHAVTFSTIKAANAFMQARGETNLEFTLISRQGFEQLLADLEHDGLSGILHNVEPDGSGGLEYSLTELIDDYRD